jgi:cell division transport system ATP-binding protein
VILLCIAWEFLVDKVFATHDSAMSVVTNQTVLENNHQVNPKQQFTNFMVQLHEVTKTYQNGRDALLRSNLQVKTGEFLFITGSSGSGKSTLLKLLYGEELATQGDVIVNDFNVSKLKGDRLSHLRQQIGIPRL